jgi:CRISPR-associated protein Csd1
MSWIQKLYDTYETVNAKTDIAQNILPIGYKLAKTHIEVCIDGNGNFLRARILENEELMTPIPVTEDSSSRSGQTPTNHPLCDKLQYLAGDFNDFGGEVTSGFKKNPQKPYENFVTDLSCWVTQSPHPMTKAILRYVQKKSLISDLVYNNILPVQNNNFIKKMTPEEKKNWPIWKNLTQNELPEETAVRWSVEIPGNIESRTWLSTTLQQNWSSYSETLLQTKNLCMVSGKNDTISLKHPNGIRRPGDRSKLISANDDNGFTFRGKFNDSTGQQACSISYNVSQKAHNALAWMIDRQGIINNKQVFVCWAVSGKPIPQPLTETHDLWDEDTPFTEEEMPTSPDHTRDAGQRFAAKLKSFIKGYTKIISPTEEIVMIGLDSATTGRMGIIYYRELLGSEFLTRLEDWHRASAWWQYFTPKDQDKKKKTSKLFWIISAPSPQNIAEAAFGQGLDDKLKKATIERLVPCIMDGQQIPLDLMTSCISRASNRIGIESRSDKKNHHSGRVEWEKCMGVACALYRSFHIRHPDPKKRKEYSMALDVTCTSRDYLYGRLLAIADHIEAIALYAANPKESSHPTAANRLMQRFADYPCSTWLTIEKSLQPYTQRLHSLRPGFLTNMNKLLDDVHALFERSDYINDTRLSGEYLLGFHCQRRELKRSHDKGENE